MKTIQKLLKRKRRDLKSKSFAAFSLPELLVVLVIIVVLMLVVLGLKVLVMLLVMSVTMMMSGSP